MRSSEACIFSKICQDSIVDSITVLQRKALDNLLDQDLETFLFLLTFFICVTITQ